MAYTQRLFIYVEAKLLDLCTLKNMWTEAGAREIFAKLVTHCVRLSHPDALTVRPNPGDDGIDVIHGPLGGVSHIWQCKFFTDGVSNSQKSQIRGSWDACTSSVNIANMTKWTLCLPIEMSVDELSWWEKWKAKQEKSFPKVAIQLWTLTKFEQFYANEKLRPLFDIALNGKGSRTLSEVLAELEDTAFRLVPIPNSAFLVESIFVRKLEKAGVYAHRAARVAFFNFELVRELIERGGTLNEREQLHDLQERVYALWEEEFNGAGPDDLGKKLYLEVIRKLNEFDRSRLATNLGLKAIHKHGIVHYWADLCEAGWTQDFRSIVGAEDGK